MHKNIILAIAIINKYLKFKMIDLKNLLVVTTACNFVPYFCVKEIEVFEQWNFLSNMHQNLISASLS